MPSCALDLPTRSETKLVTLTQVESQRAAQQLHVQAQERVQVTLCHVLMNACVYYQIYCSSCPSRRASRSVDRASAAPYILSPCMLSGSYSTTVEQRPWPLALPCIQACPYSLRPRPPSLLTPAHAAVLCITGGACGGRGVVSNAPSGQDGGVAMMSGTLLVDVLPSHRRVYCVCAQVRGQRGVAMSGSDWPIGFLDRQRRSRTCRGCTAP